MCAEDAKFPWIHIHNIFSKVKKINILCTLVALPLWGVRFPTLTILPPCAAKVNNFPVNPLICISSPISRNVWRKNQAHRYALQPTAVLIVVSSLWSKVKSTTDEMCWFLFKSYCLQTSTNQKTEWLKEDGIIDNNLECRQECREKKYKKWPKEGKKKLNFVYIHMI